MVERVETEQRRDDPCESRHVVKWIAPTMDRFQIWERRYT
jgi:hypothetical protein